MNVEFAVSPQVIPTSKATANRKGKLVTIFLIIGLKTFGKGTHAQIHCKDHKQGISEN
jgi:hypothetical protein